MTRQMRWSLEGMRAAGVKLPAAFEAELPPKPKPKPSAGWREIGGQRKYFRSRWEANYGRYLQFLVEHGEVTSWEHEKNTYWFDGIKRGTCSYLSDFTIERADGSIEEHEVKGWMDPRSATKIRRMAKYHPTVKLIVITEKDFKSLNRSLGTLIRGWE